MRNVTYIDDITLRTFVAIMVVNNDILYRSTLL